MLVDFGVFVVLLVCHLVEAKDTVSNLFLEGLVGRAGLQLNLTIQARVSAAPSPLEKSVRRFGRGVEVMANG